MRIASVRAIPLGNFGTPPPKGTGLQLCTPMTVFPDTPEVWFAPRGPVQAVLVEVTGEDGRAGYGTVGTGMGAAVYIIEQHLRHLVVGASVFDTELLWERMFRSAINYGRRGLALEAISAIDIALWDLKGQALGQPVYNLLGGRVRERIPVYASRLYATDDLEALAAEARAYQQQGFRAMKLRFGAGPAQGAEGRERNLRLVQTVREAVGWAIELAADAYMGWDVNYALQMLPQLERFGLRWLEEPVMPDDYDGYATIKAAANARGILVSGGEHEFTRWGMRELLRRRCVDILQPDVNRCGGITEAQKIWALAQAENVQVTPHAGQMHNYHLVISHLNSPIAEYFPPPAGAPDGNELFWEIFEGEPRAENGYLTLPTQPGLGIRPRPEVLQRHRVSLPAGES